MSTPTPEQERPRIDWLRIVAGALAAVSSAVLLSTLGAAGTLIGAALGSVVVSLATSLYSTGLAASRKRVAEAQTIALRRVGVAQAEVRRASRRPESSDAHLDHADDELAAAKQELAEAEDAATPPTWGERLRTLPWKRIAVFAGGVFLIAVVAITVFELIAGKPVSSITGGTGGGGTTFSRVDNGGPAPAKPTTTPTAPANSVTPSPTPSVRPSTSATPSATPSTAPSPTSGPTSPAATPTASNGAP